MFLHRCPKFNRTPNRSRRRNKKQKTNDKSEFFIFFPAQNSNSSTSILALLSHQYKCQVSSPNLCIPNSSSSSSSVNFLYVSVFVGLYFWILILNLWWVLFFVWYIWQDIETRQKKSQCYADIERYIHLLLSFFSHFLKFTISSLEIRKSVTRKLERV